MPHTPPLNPRLPCSPPPVAPYPSTTVARRRRRECPGATCPVPQRSVRPPPRQRLPAHRYCSRGVLSPAAPYTYSTSSVLPPPPRTPCSRVPSPAIHYCSSASGTAAVAAAAAYALEPRAQLPSAPPLLLPRHLRRVFAAAACPIPQHPTTLPPRAPPPPPPPRTSCPSRFRPHRPTPHPRQAPRPPPSRTPLSHVPSPSARGPRAATAAAAAAPPPPPPRSWTRCGGAAANAAGARSRHVAGAQTRRRRAWSGQGCCRRLVTVNDTAGRLVRGHT